MDEPIKQNRRRFLVAATTTMAAAQLQSLAEALAEQRIPKASGGDARRLAALSRATAWLNSPPLSSTSLLGKVVLVQFGTYTCINWLRTLPYVRAWAEKYTRGVSVIGVHTPEFTFEKNLENVRRAMQQMKIDFPIAVDNDYKIWREFNNQYWPALYMIDARGRPRYHHFGEGEYQRSELAIQRLLADAGTTGFDDGAVSVHGTGVEAAPDWNSLKSPENYVGHARTENFASPGGAQLNRQRLYAAPKGITLNQWALGGEWTTGREATILHGPNGRIVRRFHARDLHLVMGPPRPGIAIRFRVTLDGQSPNASHGGDVDDSGNGLAVEQRLYQLIRQPGPILERTFEIEFLDAGVETFAFTFG